MNINYSDFEDFEIAFLYRYRYDEFFGDIKTKITKEIEKRDLTKRKIDVLIDQKIKENNIENDKKCPRCKSDKLTILDYEQKYYGGATIFSLLDQERDPPRTNYYKCIVCGFDLRKKFRKESFKTKILKFLGIKK